MQDEDKGRIWSSAVAAAAVIIVLGVSIPTSPADPRPQDSIASARAPYPVSAIPKMAFDSDYRPAAGRDANRKGTGAEVTMESGSGDSVDIRPLLP